MSATIKDIAKAAGVSISTVSRVLTSSQTVDQEKKERVMKAVREMNYVPNSNARNLRKTQSQTVMILAKTIENPFFQNIIHNLEKLLMFRGLSLEIRNVGKNDDEIEVAKREARNSNPRGIILLGGVFGYTDEDFQTIGIPCVLVTIKADERVNPDYYSSVIIDDVAEMKRATDYLLDLGHRRIGCIHTKSHTEDTPSTLRLKGYLQALEERGIASDPQLIGSPVQGDQTGYEYAFNAMIRLMDRNPDMTAVVAMSDVLAIGAAKAIVASGRRIPEDISVMGFDGTDEAAYWNPSLDTVAQPVEQFAQKTADALMQMLTEQKTSHTVLECSLINRGSCRANP